MGRPLTSPQIQQKIICLSSNFHKTTSELRYPRKTKQSLQNEVGRKIKMKRETKDLGMETHPGEGVMKGENFPHNIKPSQRWGQWGALES